MYLKSICTFIFFIIIFVIFYPRDQKVVNILNWFNAIDTSIILQFEQETGIRVNYDVFSTNEELESKMLMGKSGYDVIFPNIYPYLHRLIDLGLLKKIAKDKIPNINKVAPEFLEYLKELDPKGDYSIPFLWGIDGFAFNKSVILRIIENPPINSLALIFEPKYISQISKCGVTLFSEANDLIPSALRYLGLNPSSDKVEDVEKAIDLIFTIRPFIQRFDVTRAIRDLGNENLCLIQNWNGEIAQLNDDLQNKKIDFSIPKEGAALYIDVIAIPVDAPNLENAYKLINFLLRPDIISKITNITYTANTVPESKKNIRKDIQENKTIYPDAQVRKNLKLNVIKSLKHQQLYTNAMLQIQFGVRTKK